MSDLRETLHLTVEEVTAPCDPGWLHFQSTEELPALDAVFGQERAVRAIEFALGMDSPGYNLFAAGPDGFGKTTIVETFLRRRAAQMPAPLDWVYVHNFEDGDSPVAISLPPGEGHAFADAMSRAVEEARREIRAAFESDSYARRRQELAGEIDQQRTTLLEQMTRDAQELGFALQFGSTGISSSPLIDGTPVSDEDFMALPEEQRNAIQERRRDLEQTVQEGLLRVRALERTSAESTVKLDEDVTAFAVGHLFEPLAARFAGDQEVRQFLDAVRHDLQRERDRFRADPQQQQQVPQMPGLGAASLEALMRRYEVNVVVGNDRQRGAPVVRESNPTYYNLLGRIEYQGQFGAAVTNHMMVKPGSLARANGGYLVLRLRDLLTNPQSLDGLKRALSSQRLAIENLNEAYGLVPTSGLRPEPIPLNVKVVVIGEGALYGLLYRYDPDFRDLFRVKADFETDFLRNQENVHGIASVVRAESERAGLAPFTRHAVEHLIEQSSRMVEDQRRLSGNIAAFLDIVRQSDFWARQAGAQQVDAEHVDRAVEERLYRSSLVRERIVEAMNNGSLYVPTDGAVVGQINALSIQDLGDITFGRPSRISCVVSAGQGAIVMVERESQMTGRIHNKGFFILRGFLSDRFGQAKASALHASLTFEQLYGDIDGDSASSTELYALLSALSEQPIDQRIAVTGSVDQYGRIQPIGGATAKIEGFFDICETRGLDGHQGVMIPAINAPNVVLRPDVAQAVREGQFHVWAVETVEEGIEVLTGIPAGAEPGADGKRPEGTIFRMVEDRLEGFLQETRHQRHTVGGVPQHVPPAQPPSPSPPGVPPEPPEPPVRV
ncbi:MAG: ATP-binding protein [Dehalococcoidia bacterium]